MTYITPEGYTLLKTKLKELWKKERPYVTQKVKEAAALGDRSENAEYIYGKRQLREIDRKIRWLSTKLDSVNVIDRLPKDQNKIYFGAWVTVASETISEQKYRLVGPDETEIDNHYISINSPLSRALIGKQVGQHVFIEAPRDESLIKDKTKTVKKSSLKYEILGINYSGPAKNISECDVQI